MVPTGIELRRPDVPGADRVLTDDALAFVADLQRRFGPLRIALLERRHERQAELDAGARPDFLVATREVRDADWTVAPAPADLDDRRVEITGPAEPKMMINALNSGARVFMADLEDALSPTWANVVGGQAALDGRRAQDLTFDRPRARRTGSTSGSRRWSSGRAAGTWSSRGCSSTASRSRPACSTSGSTCSTTAPRRCGGGAARTSTSPSSSPTTRRASGTRSSSTARPRSGSRAGRSARPSSSRRSWRRSRWTRSSTSSASTRPASTPAAGTTCSAGSRSCGPGRNSRCRTGRS